MGRLIPLFLDDSNWRAMPAIIESWHDTPYRHMAMVKKRGADCTLFLAAIWKEAGYLEKVEKLDYYPRDWHIHTSEEMVKDSLVHHLKNNMAPGLSASVFEDREAIDAEVEAGLIRGDLLGFKMIGSQTTNHTTMWLGDDEWMIHCFQRRGVSRIEFNNWWQKHMTILFRLMIEVN